jgi:hypothetical protein
MSWRTLRALGNSKSVTSLPWARHLFASSRVTPLFTAPSEALVTIRISRVLGLSRADSRNVMSPSR